MPELTSPSEIAREVLRLFAARRISPTPDNFRMLYEEVSGTSDEGAASPDRLVRDVASRVPRDTPERLRHARQIDEALAAGDAEEARQALFRYLTTIAREHAPAWNTLIAHLLRHWEARQTGWTSARKREALDRVLAADDPATLQVRLQGLLRAWARAPAVGAHPDADASHAQTTGPDIEPMTDAGRAWPTATDLSTATGADIARTRGSGVEAPTEGEEASPIPTEVAPARDTAIPVRLVAAGEAGEIIASLRELLVFALDTVVPAFLAEHPELITEVEAFAAAVRSSTSAEQLRILSRQLRNFAYRLELAAEDTAEIRAGLTNLFGLLLENIEEIVVDEQWLHGQVEMLREVVGKPATVRMIDDAERRLKEIIFKQSQLKHNLVEAQRTLKETLAGFVDQLATLSENTGTYHDRIATNAQKIAQARDISEIGPLLDQVMRDTHGLQEDTLRTRDELRTAQDRVAKTEQRIASLQQALDETTRLLRHDQLTGALNRRGLEEIFDKEAARAKRRNAPLCIALIDIDDFKRLNDSLGHQAGDDALVHLVTMMQRNLRPNDTIARLGGEEFIILCPESDPDQARAALVRLQRELTRELFLTENRKILITFSAGISQWAPDEPLNAVVNRADEAMYRAKQTGKNKVVAATSTLSG